MKEELMNRVEIFNEGATLLMSYSLLVFTDFVKDAKTRYQLGLFPIMIFLNNFGLNLFVIIYKAISPLVDKIVRKIDKK